MRRLASVSIIITFLTACGPAAQSPPGNPPPTPTPDLRGRFVEVPANQPFRYSVVGAGQLRVGPLSASQFTVGPTFNNLRVVGVPALGRFIVTFDGSTQPDQNSNLIVKALAEGGKPNHGPYVVFFVGFNVAGIELGLRDVTGRSSPDFDEVKVMVEISQYVRTN